MKRWKYLVATYSILTRLSEVAARRFLVRTPKGVDPHGVHSHPVPRLNYQHCPPTTSRRIR